jgi:stress response protein SCP2
VSRMVSTKILYVDLTGTFGSVSAERLGLLYRQNTFWDFHVQIYSGMKFRFFQEMGKRAGNILDIFR